MKINRILPIAALTGIAMVATPLVTSCNKGDGYIPLNTEGSYSTVSGTVKFLRTAQTLSFDTTSIYSVKFSWNRASSINCQDIGSGWQIACGRLVADSTLIPNSIADDENLRLYLNDQPLVKNTDYRLQSAGGANIIIPQKALELDENSIIKAEFKLGVIASSAEQGWIGVIGRPL